MNSEKLTGKKTNEQKKKMRIKKTAAYKLGNNNLPLYVAHSYC